LSQIAGVENADLFRIHGMHHALEDRADDADEMFEEGINLLQSLEAKLTIVYPGIHPPSNPKAKSDTEPEVFLNHVVAAILSETGE
jgi:hypothetical protein